MESINVIGMDEAVGISVTHDMYAIGSVSDTFRATIANGGHHFRSVQLCRKLGRSCVDQRCTAFSDVASLIGGTGTDDFELDSNGLLTGMVDGGKGANSLALNKSGTYCSGNVLASTD